MPDQPKTIEADERLARLGREWFAEVRRRHPEEPKTRRRDGGNAPDGDAEGVWDLLFGSGDGGESGGSDCGGD